jgi:RNA polymerase sigma factor (sigma-70 family)
MAKNNQTDLKRWASFRNGDDLALAVIYSENVEILYKYGLKFTSNKNVIEDTIHDLFIDLIRSRQTLGETDNILYYLLKSFRRKLIRQLHGESRYGEDLFQEIQFGVHYSIEQEIISEEHRNKVSRQLQQATDQLSPRQKEAIYLKFTEGLDYKEISAILGMGIEASRNLIYRAIKSLKETLSNSPNPLLLFLFKKISHSLKKVQLF